jgi:cobaltochelatase CobS
MNIAELEDAISKTKTPATKAVLEAELQKLKLQGQANQGDDVAKMLVALKETIDTAKRNGNAGSGVSKAEVEDMLKEVLNKNKIRLEDLDDTLRSSLTKSMRVGLNLTTSTYSGPAGVVPQSIYELPIFQKILSDAAAQNNVYLFGSAGSGKSFISEQIAKFLDYEFILLPCNQFTSPLEVLGGQTIDGYQFAG